jgi:ABC-type branched-subunit amino acid transport system ATPase component
MSLTVQPSESLESPLACQRRLDRLRGKRDEVQCQHHKLTQELQVANDFLAVADQVTAALEQLSNDLFRNELNVIESTLTKALQEVLDQPIVFKAEASFRNGATSVEFAIERNGHIEDIMKGQGGSVANVVSVGLRMFAVTMLDEAIHRRFLVLDEQDCWLHPDLVPRLVKIVHDAGTALGFQVLMISHHDVNSFIRYADRVYRMSPDRGDGVKLERIEDDSAVVEDEHAS